MNEKIWLFRKKQQLANFIQLKKYWQVDKNLFYQIKNKYMKEKQEKKMFILYKA